MFGNPRGRWADHELTLTGDHSGPEVLLKHSIVPSERSLEPETCIELRAGTLYLKDQVRQAKADFPLVLVD
jgi:hypothetical protein